MFIADFHIHSKYSRATSKNMDIPEIEKWAKIKGINLVGTGDFTHSLWLMELKKYLKPVSKGIWRYNQTNFMLTAEVSNIYYKNGATRKVHNLIFAPDFDVVGEINIALSQYGKIESDGRPILSLDSEDLVKLVLDISPECLIIPAHAWTPHFSVFGSNSGFNSLEECFGKQTKNIYAIETGLSSDPQMNWRLSALDNITLISNSDAHSPKNLGREATVFDCEIDYAQIIQAIKTKDKSKILYTIEFFPEEGKYHYDGHRNCNVRIHPREAINNNNLCPFCGKVLTIGVLHRVEELADREKNTKPVNGIPFKNLVPLEEIIADALGLGKGTTTVEKEYIDIVSRVGTEFDILLEISEEKLQKSLPAKIVDKIIKMRRGEVEINPGYDGVYGEIKIGSQQTGGIQQNELAQMTLF